ncbi:MAG: cytidine deaminase [Planctomycetota bacterium]|nr:MAG: cytidine deaminase [Planctomycetota bacterium]
MSVDQEQEWHELLRRANQARAAAYAPYSRFAVGAAVLTSDGRCFTGCNVENASYGLTICAERVAAAAAVAAGARELRAVAVVAEPVAFPCGACRQFLDEFASPQGLMVVVGTRRGEIVAVHALHDLLPQSFGGPRRRDEDQD